MHAIYDKVVPFQRTNQRIADRPIEKNNGKLNQLMQRYSKNDQEKWDKIDAPQKQEPNTSKNTNQKETNKNNKSECQYIYDTPEGKTILY